jgi:hypothetical protein
MTLNGVQLTPETIATLSREDKKRAIEILENLAIPAMERRHRAIHEYLRNRTPAQIEADKLNMESGTGVKYAEVLSNMRERLHSMSPEEYAAHKAERDKEYREWAEWKDRQRRAKCIAEGRNPDADEVKDSWRKLRETNPRAGGSGVDRILGEETPPELTVQKPVEPAGASNLPRPVSIAEVARHAQEQAFAEANREEPDFINRICGPGSTKPSGSTRGGKLGFMG